MFFHNYGPELNFYGSTTSHTFSSYGPLNPIPPQTDPGDYEMLSSILRCGLEAAAKEGEKGGKKPIIREYREQGLHLGPHIRFSLMSCFAESSHSLQECFLTGSRREMGMHHPQVTFHLWKVKLQTTLQRKSKGRKKGSSF